jgi:hypothetical protein
MRRKNVVMHRVEEAGADVKTMEERKKWDMLSCDNIFAALQLNMQAEQVIRFCRRIDEKGEGPRPLVVGFMIEGLKEDLMDSDVNVHKTNSFFRPDFQFVSISKRNVIIYSL